MGSKTSFIISFCWLMLWMKFYKIYIYIIKFAQKTENFDLQHFWKDYSISQKESMLKRMLIFGNRNYYYYFYLLKICTSTLDLSKSKCSLLKRASLEYNIPTKICTNQEGQNMQQIFLGALEHDIASSLCEVQ